MPASDNSSRKIVIAGATGALGKKLAGELMALGHQPTAIVRPESDAADVEALRDIGARIVEIDTSSRDAVADACQGATCVVSCLAGLRPVIVDAQRVLLDGAVKAGVSRFIPSDFAIDFYKVPDGRNRNLDLRREFAAYMESQPVRATSILNGLFSEFIFLSPYVMFPVRRCLYFGDKSQKLDVTGMDDTARYTAHAALDDDSPRYLRIAGNVVDITGMAREASAATGSRFKPLYGGPMGLLRGMISMAKRFDSGKALYPPFQGMQYMENMFSGEAKLEPLDNDRYGMTDFKPIRATLTEGKPDFMGE